MKRVLLFIFIIALSSGVYFYLKYYYEKDQVDIWDLVPENVLLAYETEQPIAVWNDFVELPLWNNLSGIPQINSINQTLMMLDSVTGAAGNLERLFLNREFVISLHKISSTDFGLIFYLNINTQEKRKILAGIMDHFLQTAIEDHEIRNFENIAIHELYDEGDTLRFSYIEHKGFFVGSFTPFLIDDVVRNISNDFQTNFKAVSADIFNAQPIETDEGNLYINLLSIPELVENFSTPGGRGRYEDYLKWFSGATYYDIDFEKNRIFFNGSSRIPADQQEYFLSTFYDQTPQDLQAIYFLPDRTATYLSYTCEEFAEWRRSVDQYWEKNYPDVLKKKAEFFQEYEMYERDFYTWIDNEIGLATLQSLDPDHPDKLFIIRSKDYTAATAALDDLIATVNRRDSDTTLYEDFSGKRIKRIAIPELPATILGEEFLGFEHSYYTDIGSYIVIGNSFEVVKHLLGEIEEENTWGKSLKFMQYFENVQKRANVSYFVNFSNAWNAFFNALNKEWQTFFKSFDHEFKHFEILSFQFSNINNSYYTSAAIQHRPETSVIATPAQFFREQVVVSDYPLVTKPYVFRSHLDRSLEVMVMDAGNQLYLISSDGEVLWKRKVGERIKSDIFQVDFYKNGKLQYLFATDSSLFIYDRNGNLVGGFPVRLDPSLDLQYMNLIDYDNSRNYRYLLCDVKGDIYLTNKEGKGLEGWQPRPVGGQFANPPFHVRISGRDCMIAIQSDGTINMMNRRSENYEGFPLNLGSALSGPVFIQRGIDFNRSIIHLVNASGEVVKVNFNGQVTSRQQLYRPDQESRFSIVPDALNNTYVISRQDFNGISVLNQAGETLFERELLFTDEMEVQFYNFSAGNEVYVFTDQQQGFTYLFDGNGDLINMQPVESGFKVALIFSEVSNKYYMYSCYGNQFSLISFFRK